jgi:hypothetical protein
MKSTDEDDFDKIEGIAIGVGGLIIFGAFIAIAVFAAPYLDQFFRWVDGR